MKLLKTDWIHHDGKPIFSVDVHPDGSKLATGGHGNDAGRVTIWNMRPILSASAAADPQCARILCQLDQHAGCVNCVRWSSDGRLLASGGDDKVVMVWKRGKGPSAVFGNGGITKVAESWRCAVTLRGHEGDVLDVAWSAQDRWLATCSVDNTIMVWDVAGLAATGTAAGGGGGAPRAAWLRGHTGMVKGVAWDPVGKFIASQSDDRTVRIWRTADWTCAATISEPFEECGGTTHILRLSWSPDGLYLVSAHAMNGGGPTAQIIEREAFKCDKDFVGHRKAVTCVRFHSAILRRQAPKTQRVQQYCCLAIGSRDRSVSVWMTALQRPLVVVHDLFRDSVLDLSWSMEHNILMAASNDGTVACLQFGAEELGSALTAAEKDGLYQRMYGQSAAEAGKVGGVANATQEGEVLLEYAELLRDESGAEKADKVVVVNGGDGELNAAAGTPMDVDDGAAAAALVPQGQQQPVARLVFSTETEVGRPMTPVKPAIIKQFETRAKDGRRRITPAFIPLDQETLEYSAAPEIISSSRSNSTVAVEVIKPPPEKIAKLAEPSHFTASAAANPPSSSAASATSQTAKSLDASHLDSRLSKTVPSKTQTLSATTTTSQQQSTANNNPSNSNSNTANNQPQTATTEQQQQQQPLNRPIVFTTGKAQPFRGTHSKCTATMRLSITNEAQPTPFGPLSRMTAHSRQPSAATGQQQQPSSSPLWELLVGSAVVNFALSSRFACVCSADGTVRLVDAQSGVLALPLLKMPQPAVQCCFSPNSELVALVTESGVVRVWRLQPAPARIQLNTTCTDILSGGYVSNFHVTDGGVVFVVLASGSSFSYCERLESWLVVNSRDPIIRTGCAQLQQLTAAASCPLPPTSARTIRDYPLHTVQTLANQFPAPGRPTHPANNNSSTSSWQLEARLAFIDHQLRLSESVGTARELEHWYAALAAHLAEHGPERRIRLLLDELMGVPPMLGGASRNLVNGGDGDEAERRPGTATPKADGKGAPGKYLGLLKLGLLRAALDKLQAAPRWQRIYFEYSEQLIEREQMQTEEEERISANDGGDVKFAT